jgi:integrase/recombinase XerD
MIALLRQWWKARRGFDAHTTPLQERWLFPGRKPGQPMSTRQLNRLFHEAADGAGIRKGVSLHTLRHNAESRIMPSDFAMPPRSARMKASVRSAGPYYSA